MNTLWIEVSGIADNKLTFSVIGKDRKSILAEIEYNLEANTVNTGYHVRKSVPDKLITELKRLTWADPSLENIVIVAKSADADAIPWETLPDKLNASNLFVVRQFVPLKDVSESTQQFLKKILAAGWSGSPTFTLPGIETELAALRNLGRESDFEVQIMFEPSVADLANSCLEFQPDILHLLPAAILPNKEQQGIILSSEGSIQAIPIQVFLSKFLPEFRPKIVIVNTCHGADSTHGISAIRQISERFDSVAIGFEGKVTDVAAVDFTRFLYARFLEGSSVVSALCSYRKIMPGYRKSRQSSRGMGDMEEDNETTPLPVVWTPNIEIVLNTVVPDNFEGVKQVVKSHGPANRSIPPLPGSSISSYEIGTSRSIGSNILSNRSPRADEKQPDIVVNLEFKPPEWLNPAMLKNGEPAINSLAVVSNMELPSVLIEVACDTGKGYSSVRHTMQLKNGLNPVDVSTWHFPVLYQMIADKIPRRHINFTASCRLSDLLLAEKTRSVLWMDNTEWLDRPDAWRFLPAFVQPLSERVQELVESADIVLKNMKGPKSNFDGYDSNDVNYVLTQVTAIFNALRNNPLHYTAPPPLEVYVPDQKFATGQRVRDPAEVLERKRGTCHDLAILFASCIEQIQLYPLIVLITGHTFLGFWKEKSAQKEFWEKATNQKLRRPNDPDRGWTITDRSEIEELVNREVICLVDAVMLTDSNAQYDQAERKGFEYFMQSAPEHPVKRKFDVAIDIKSSRRKVQPI